MERTQLVQQAEGKFRQMLILQRKVERILDSKKYQDCRGRMAKIFARFMEHKKSGLCAHNDGNNEEQCKICTGVDRNCLSDDSRPHMVRSFLRILDKRQ